VPEIAAVGRRAPPNVAVRDSAVTPEVAGSSPVAPVLCTSRFRSVDEGSDVLRALDLSGFVRFDGRYDAQNGAPAAIPEPVAVSSWPRK
jgi:hypothetical protein